MNPLPIIPVVPVQPQPMLDRLSVILCQLTTLVTHPAIQPVVHRALGA